MRYRNFGAGAALLVGMGLAMAAAPASSSADKISAQSIKYADLGKLIRAQRGKVVLVDFWSVY